MSWVAIACSFLLPARVLRLGPRPARDADITCFFATLHERRRFAEEGAVRTVIFDLDGTLADTSADLIAAANHCFRGLGYGDVLHPVEDAETAFRGGRAMLRLGFGRVRPGFAEADVDAQYQRLLDAYEAGIDRETRLYPGAEEAVRALVADGYATGICTNKPERLAEILTARLGMRELFGSLVGADTLAHRKPHPAPYLAAVERAGGAVASSVLIGDTVTDRDTARAVGVPVVLVSFGPGGGGAEALEPDALLGHFGELPGVVARLIG
jgi:phosphoglycolate phosphatase